VEDAGVFLAEALVQWDNLGSHPLVHRHVRHRRQQPAVTQLTLHSIKKVNVYLLHWLSIILGFSLISTITNNYWQIIYDDISVIDISQFNSQRTGKPFGHSSK
jgi:hypothetical protein